MLSKVKYAIFQQRRHRLNYFFNSIFVHFSYYVAVNFFTSIYQEISSDVTLKQSPDKFLDFGFSISSFYGSIYTLFFIARFFFLWLFDIQRLRDMGIQFPIFLGIVLVLLKLISGGFGVVLGKNFVSFFIDAGLLISGIVMLFTAPKLSASERARQVEKLA